MDIPLDQLFGSIIAMGVLIVLVLVFCSFLLHGIGIKLGAAVVGERVDYGKALVIALLGTLLAAMLNTAVIAATGRDLPWLGLVEIAVMVICTSLLLMAMAQLPGIKALCASLLAYLFSGILCIALALGLVMVVQQQAKDIADQHRSTRPAGGIQGRLLDSAIDDTEREALMAPDRDPTTQAR